MSKRDDYRAKLRTLKEWDAYLLRESGLPGPRGNLELAQAVADEGNAALFLRYAGNSGQEYLALCGAIGLGRLIAEGRVDLLARLRALASDSRWRVREGVAMGLQRWGDADFAALVRKMDAWSRGNALEQRACAAALCEPRLLRDAKQIARVLRILDRITASLGKAKTRERDGFIALKKGLAYCWSVAVAASPEPGKRAMERWFASDDPDVRWIMRENLKKDRLARRDAAWVKRWKAKLGGGK